MSRVANSPITIPAGVDVKISDATVSVKGPKGEMEINILDVVKVVKKDTTLEIEYDVENKESNMHAGTTRALLNNIVHGVTKGFERKLELVGVGYRAKAEGNILNLTLGFSHPVRYTAPKGITIETPTQTEIWVKGVNKEKVGQVAAEIRAYRQPEPYKGKGVRYAGERISLKEAKKK